jgi:Ca-activated chloride channel family protein
MKQLLIVFLFCIFFSASFCQYYLRGEIRDVKGKLLPGVKINLFSKGTFSYTSGSSGSFGIPTNLAIDTIMLTLEGYEVLKQAVDSKKSQSFILKMLPATASLMRNKLTSLTKNLSKEQAYSYSAQGESYSSLVENSFIPAKLYPQTGFSLNIDRASYSNARRFLNNETNVPPDAVRIEEMLNYFSFKSSNENNPEKKFSCNTYITNCPWNKTNQLLFVNLNAPKLNLDSVPPSNLVFLIDISGSMDKPNRLPLLQSAFKMLTNNLRDKDTVAVVVYGGGVARILNPTSGSEKEIINTIIDSLTASGDTPGEGAIESAYRSARETFIKGGNNRVILATDGDFNVGQTSEKSLEDLIIQQRQYGIYLTCLGVGMGNYKDSKLETLAKKGNGNFAYLDNTNEAQKVLITEFTKTLYSVANDASLSITFNSDLVKEHRLIGFDNKKASVEDSTSELEGGEVGSGHSMMAIFEFTPQEGANVNSTSLGKIYLQYKVPKETTFTYQKFDIPYHLTSLDAADSSLKFATAVTMFGALLKQSKYAKEFSFTDTYKLALSAAKKNDYAQQEFLQLVQKANKIYNPRKKKRGRNNN